MQKVKIFCNYCGNEVFKEPKEINRQLKKNANAKFYCNNTCSGLDKGKYIIKQCPVCNNYFECKISNKRTNKTFCSRECASAGSITKARIEAGRKVGLLHNASNSLDLTASSLRSRESWKYKKIKQYLIDNKINYQFEYVIEKFIYDLALIDLKILIEFDGPYHEWLDDNNKDILALSYNWKIIRIKTEPNTEIEIDKLVRILQK